MSNILITICARGGSKGIPGKNIRPLNGKPLIAYSIECAKEFVSKQGGKVALSTDSEEIRKVAASFGLYTEYTRPSHLATDKVGKVGVLQHLLEFEEESERIKYDYILDLDITSPLRTQQDLNEAFNKLKEFLDAVNIFSVSPASRNPYFNMVEMTENGYVKTVKDAGNILSRQAAPVVYDMNASFYFFRRTFFEEGYTISTTDKSLAYVMSHICFDLDEPHDFTIMEIMLKENLLNFSI